MLLTGKLNTILNTGSPLYNICGQSSKPLDWTSSNVGFRMELSKANGATNTLVNTSDLNTLIVGGLPYGTFNYGDYDIEFEDFKIDIVNSAFQAKINIYIAGTTDKVTWEKFNLYIEVTQSSFITFSNTFEFYGYDVGNTTGTSGFTATTGNKNFEIFLVDYTNNLDIYGRQTKAYSSFLALRRPFTREIHVYSMVGTQGIITYADVNSVQIGTGKHIQIFDDKDYYVEQTVTLPADYCVSSTTILSVSWLPKFISSYSGDSQEPCDECINTLNGLTASWFRDASETNSFNVDGSLAFLTEFMTQKISAQLINYKSEIEDNQDWVATVLTYAAWIANPADFTTPTEQPFIPSDIGIHILSFINLFEYIGVENDIELYKCIYNYNINTCHHWIVESTVDCNIFKITNCSANTLTIKVKQLQDDKSFTLLSTVEILTLESEEITFAVDGLYTLVATSSDITGEEIYTLPIFCGILVCVKAKLDEILCIVPSENNCSEVKHYDFNAFIASAHSFFLLLNKELNYNFVYSTLPADKIEELYTMKTFIDRMAEYCSGSESPCLPCNQ